MITISQVSQQAKDQIVKDFRKQGVTPKSVRQAAFSVVYDELGLEVSIFDILIESRQKRILDQVRTDWRGYSKLALQIYYDALLAGNEERFTSEYPEHVTLVEDTINDEFGPADNVSTTPAPEPKTALPETIPDATGDSQPGQVDTAKCTCLLCSPNSAVKS